jgi:hypothetical protein
MVYFVVVIGTFGFVFYYLTTKLFSEEDTVQDKIKKERDEKKNSKKRN